MADDWIAVPLPIPVSTTFDIPGRKIVRHIGPVFGVTVRSGNIGTNFVAAFRTITGGEVTGYTRIANQVRHEAVARMVWEAQQLGGNAVVGMRFDGSEIMQGMTEVFCYGTAVVVQ